MPGRVLRVIRDINVLEDHTLNLDGVTLEFDEGVGMIVQGTLKTSDQSLKTIFRQRRKTAGGGGGGGGGGGMGDQLDGGEWNMTEGWSNETEARVRLILDGAPSHQGRIEVKIKGEWGTVCDRVSFVDSAFKSRP